MICLPLTKIVLGRCFHILKAIEAEAVATTRTQPGQFARANYDFRHAMFDGISNRVLNGVIAQFASHLHFFSATLNNIESRREIVNRQRKIRDALQERDGDLAEGLWRSYLRLTKDALTSAISDLEGRAKADAKADAA